MKKHTSHKKYGWRGRILRVDLSDAKISDEELPEELTEVLKVPSDTP